MAGFTLDSGKGCLLGHLLVGGGEEANGVLISVLGYRPFFQDGRWHVLVIHDLMLGRKDDRSVSCHRAACLMRTTMCFPTYDSWPCWETADLGEHHLVDLAV